MVESRENMVYNGCNVKEIICEIANELGIKHSSYEALITKLAKDPASDEMSIIAMELLVNNYISFGNLFRKHFVSEKFNVHGHKLIKNYIVRRFILNDTEFNTKAFKVEKKMKQIKLQ